MTRREFIQYLYEEKLKEELKSMPLKRLILKDKFIWYAEPGNAQAVDSFDRRRYEMVRAPRSASTLLFCPAPLILLSSSFAIEPPSSRIRPRNGCPCHILEPYEERRTEGYIRGFRKASRLSWNWASRSIELRRIAPKRPYRLIETRLLLNLLFPSADMVRSS